MLGSGATIMQLIRMQHNDTACLGMACLTTVIKALHPCQRKRNRIGVVRMTAKLKPLQISIDPWQSALVPFDPTLPIKIKHCISLFTKDGATRRAIKNKG
jgi:hypothetical protein